jgi:hypothetical protein
MNDFNALLMPFSFLRRWSCDELIPALLYFDRVRSRWMTLNLDTFRQIPRADYHRNLRWNWPGHYRENAFSSSGVAEPAMNGWKVIGKNG